MADPVILSKNEQRVTTATTSTRESNLTSMADPSAVADAVREANAARQPLHPRGGGTSLDYGGTPTHEGRELDLTELGRIVDYTPRDMTIVVEAGVRMADLAATLAAEGQQLPIDVPRPAEATVGGAVATNWSGPRRYGYGTLRDYLIGIRAVDGRGVPFQAGGRVVKNVAGYDFCKLLTGSLGTLAVITQVTLKVKPIPEAVAWVVCDTDDDLNGFIMFLSISDSRTTPVAIEWVGGAYWQKSPLAEGTVRAQGSSLAICFEGSRSEVEWQVERFAADRLERPAVYRDASIRQLASPESAQATLSALTAFPADATAPLSVRFNLSPGDLNIAQLGLHRAGGNHSYQAHRGNGILNVRFENVAPADVSRLVLKDLQPMAAKAGGNVIVLSCPGQELTRQLTWGLGRGDRAVMLAVKQQFDPAGILNPGRFVY